MTTSAKKALLAIATITVFVTGCGLLSRKVKLGEEFVMKPHDKVIVSGTGLEIRVETIGHQTASNAQSQPVKRLLRENDGNIRWPVSVHVGG